MCFIWHLTYLGSILTLYTSSLVWIILILVHSSNFTLIKDCPSRTKGRLDFTLNFVRCFRSGQHLACHSLRWDYLRPKLCFFWWRRKLFFGERSALHLEKIRTVLQWCLFWLQSEFGDCNAQGALSSEHNRCTLEEELRAFHKCPMLWGLLTFAAFFEWPSRWPGIAPGTVRRLRAWKRTNWCQRHLSTRAVPA